MGSSRVEPRQELVVAGLDDLMVVVSVINQGYIGLVGFPLRV